MKRHNKLSIIEKKRKFVSFSSESSSADGSSDEVKSDPSLSFKNNDDLKGENYFI